MAISDEDLMRLVQTGQLAVFEELVHRYRNALVRVAASKLGDRQVAEDVVQEALLAAFAARQTFNPAYKFRTWLWTIALRLCQKQGQRSRGPQQSLVAPNSPVVQSAAVDGPHGLQSLLTTEQSELLQQALSALPEAEADALRLRFFGGLPFDDIAAAMDSSVSGAKQRVKHGLARLALRLQTLSGVES
ncbi:sigma-70 family RNA polymerase sigma factor [bacterium]|nr:sigma-70 family RNA polymerase sigma factor [bacterium]